MWRGLDGESFVEAESIEQKYDGKASGTFVV